MFSEQGKYNLFDRVVLSEYNSLRSKKAQKKLCHAPFGSLRFSQSGNVLACCFNRGYVLGKYPDQSVHDSWFGEKISKLRKCVSGNDLSLGCGECARRIENRLFNLSGSLQYDYLAEYGLGSYPAMLDFEISNICNLECRMCLGENSSAIRCNREKLPPYELHYDHQFVEQLKEFIPHIKEARFSGGEPFLVPLYYDLWNLLIEENPKAEISVLTNATVLNEKVKNLIANGNFRLSVSVDSLNKETYEKIRVNADFDTVFSNMEYFYDYSLRKNSVFCLNVCPLPYNWSEIPAIVKYCNEKNILLVLHSVIFPPAESLWAKESSELIKISDQLKKENVKASGKFGDKNISSYQNLVNQMENWAVKAVEHEKLKKELSGKNENELLLVFGQHLFGHADDYAKQISGLLLESDFSEKERKNIILNLLCFSPDLIISELLHSEPEKMKIRLGFFNY
jgi:MoaA/NifB/PqqE/SkfB family radical SAM enzyme